MDRKQDKDMTEQQECPWGKVQKLDKGVNNEEERESLPTFSINMDKIDALRDLQSTEELRERYNKLIEEGKFHIWEAEDPIFKIQQSLLEQIRKS